MRSRPGHVWHAADLRRWLVVLVSLAGYLASVVGVAVPRLGTRLPDARRYPCEHHACGCQSAEECWASCCCYTPRQKLAWAREHGVAPPPELIAQVSALDAEQTACSAGRACCRHHEHDLVQRDVEHADRDEVRFADGATSNSRVILLLGALVRQCRGMANLWVAMGAVTPPPAAVRWDFDWNLVESIATNSASLTAVDLAPPVPPPRV